MGVGAHLFLDWIAQSVLRGAELAVDLFDRQPQRLPHYASRSQSKSTMTHAPSEPLRLRAAPCCNRRKRHGRRPQEFLQFLIEARRVSYGQAVWSAFVHCQARVGHERNNPARRQFQRCRSIAVAMYDQRWDLDCWRVRLFSCLWQLWRCRDKPHDFVVDRSTTGSGPGLFG